MLDDEPVAGFYAPVRRSLTEPILLAGTPRSVAILNGTLAAAIGLGLRLWLVGAVLLVRLPTRRRLGDQARCRLRGRGAPPSALSGPSGGVMMNLAEYRRKSQLLADYLPWAALVAKGIVLNKDGSLPAHRPVSGSGSGQRDARRAGGDHLAPQQCVAPAGLRLGHLHRGAARARQPLSQERLSRSGLPHRRCRAQGTVRGRRHAFREPVFPDAAVAAAGR